jgi:aminoglycoside phosphotransferase (APT) family kinase protein
VNRDEIDAGLARRLIDRQFPEWADLEIRRVGLDGWDNRTFRLGDELSIRLPTGPWYAQQVEKEQTWLPRLAPVLPLPIPVPVAKGEPGEGYPFPWSVYRWHPGEPAAIAPPADRTAFARDLAEFLNALAAADASGAPGPGEHNFHRGGPLAHYEHETLAALERIGDEIDQGEARRTWEEAMRAGYDGEPVWFHGDVAVGNLLVRDGRLSAVLDFGTSGAGDPACDTVIAWTYLEGASRDAFMATYAADAGTWARGRGWALWKALITLAGSLDEGDGDAVEARRREIRAITGDRTLGP